MDFSQKIAWGAKITFWIATTLLTIGVYMTRSPWWLTGFGLFLLVSFRALALCRMPLSAIFPLFLCNIYFVVVFFKIVSDKSASTWWLSIALFLEFMIVGSAQNQIDEDEKKSKIAEETEKKFAAERKVTATVMSENIIKEKKCVSSTKKKKVAKNDFGISIEDKNDDNFWKQKIEEHIRQLKSDENIVNRNIGDMLGLNYSDEDPVEGEWKEEKFLEIRDKLFYYFGESILKFATEENIPVKSNRLTGLYADTICMMAFQNSTCNILIPKIFSLSLYIGTEQAKKFIKVMSEFDKIPDEELKRLEIEERQKKDEFPHIWFYRKVKRYALDFNGKGGTFSQCYPAQLLRWFGDKKDESLSDYMMRNLDNHLQKILPIDEESEDSDIVAMNNSISPESGSNLEDEQDDEMTSEQCFTEMSEENPTNDESEPDALSETIRAVEKGDWKKVGKIVGKGIWNTLIENVEDTRRYRNEFQNLSPYELAAICKNTWKSSAERAAAFHVLKMKVPDEGERRRMLR